MKKKGILLSFFIILIMITSYAYAAVSVDTVTSIPQYKNVYEQGDTFDVDFKLENYSFDRKGIDEFVIKMDIDKNVIEPVTVENIITEDGMITVGDNQLHVEDVNSATHDEVIFSDLATDCDYKIFIDLNKPYTMENFNSNPVLLKFRFKIKEAAPVSTDSTVVRFSTDVATQVTAADLKNNFAADRANNIKDEVVISVKEANVSAPTENIVDNTTNNVVNNTTNKVDNTNISNKTNVVNSVNNTSKNNTTENTTTNKANNTSNTSNKSNVVNSANNTSKNTNNTANKTNNTANKSNTTSNKASNSNASKSNSVSANSPAANTANKVIPKAGAKLLFLPVLVVLGLAVVFYIKVRKYKEID